MHFPLNRLTILSRLVIGYLVIFFLVIAMNIYVIVQIGQFNKITRSVLTTNDRLIETIGRFTDAVLSKTRYEKKFLITKDEAFYDQFLRLKTECDQYLKELLTTAETGQAKGLLHTVTESYQTYELLLNEEVKHLKSGLSYAEQRRTQEKDRLLNIILEELDKLMKHIRQNTDGKMIKLYDLGANTRTMVAVMTGAFFIISISISLLINRTITQPVATMKKKTKEIAKGNFRGDLNLTSPPELGELADAFNLMCNKLQELDEMKSDFFNSISHELRTPLSTTKMGIELLKGRMESVCKEDQKTILETIYKENNRVIDLVNSLLDLAKMEAGMMTFNFEPKEITPLIKKVVDEMGPLIKAKEIALETTIIETLPSIKMDSERILQVLRNLIGNALKFTPLGGRVTVSALSRDGGVEISVADTGPGIPAESLTSIFEKFKQLTTKDSRQIKGTGLGLAIARQIVTSHGGKIWAESEPGKGSTFVFVLPI
jgi:two-component system, NtrC family, sensor histidine kinase GlrK